MQPVQQWGNNIAIVYNVGALNLVHCVYIINLTYGVSTLKQIQTKTKPKNDVGLKSLFTNPIQTCNSSSTSYHSFMQFIYIYIYMFHPYAWCSYSCYSLDSHTL